MSRRRWAVRRWAVRRRAVRRGLIAVALAYAAAVVFGYVLAARARTEDEEATARAALVGLNAAGNVAVSAALGAPGAGVALGAIGAASLSDDLARDRTYQRALAWASWLMPMSWLATGLGLGVFALNLLGAAVTGNRVERARIHRVFFEREHGVLVMEGGWVFRPGFKGAFDAGNLVFLRPGTEKLMPHELGHVLNVAALGSVFHLTGGLEQNVLRRGPKAYAERLAESRRQTSRPGTIAWWGAPEETAEGGS
jgi:hypothetical protein